VTATLTACVCLFLLAFATAASGKQAEAGNPEPKVEAAPEMVPRAWWLAERRAKKKALKVAFRLRLDRQALRRRLKQRWAPTVGYAIKLASVIYGVPSYQLHRVASCESGHDPFAVNGQYRGVFQEGGMFERGPFGRAGFSVFDPLANVLTAASTVAREGWSQWQCKP
jgi:hypothetical protein